MGLLDYGSVSVRVIQLVTPAHMLNAEWCVCGGKAIALYRILHMVAPDRFSIWRRGN